MDGDTRVGREAYRPGAQSLRPPFPLGSVDELLSLLKSKGDREPQPRVPFGGVASSSNGSRVEAGPQRRRGFWFAACVLGVVALGYAGAAAVTRPDLGFWSPDSSIRYVQLVSLLGQGYREVAAVYPGAELDPEARFYPVSRGFAAVRQGRVYLLYTPYLAALTGPPYRVLGRSGLVVLPLTSGLLVVWVTQRRLAQEAQLVASAGALSVGLGTPLLIYSAVFWDHAPVTALAAGSLVLLFRGAEERRAPWVLLGGVLAGVASWFRNEGYVFAAAATTATALALGARDAIQLLVGFVCGAAPAWFLNWYFYGHPLGLKGLAAAEAVRGRLGGWEGWVRDRLIAAYDLLVSTEQLQNALAPVRVAESVGLAAVLLASAVLLRAGTRAGNRWSVAAAGLAVAAGTAWLVSTDGAEVMGLVPALPALILVGLWEPRATWERLAAWAAGLYVAGVVALGSVGGLQWGPRYLLPAVPPLVWLGWAGFARACRVSDPAVRKALVLTALLVVLASVAVQIRGLVRVRAQVQTGGRVEAILRSSDSPILVTGREALFRVMGYLYFDRILMTVESVEELRDLVERFASRRVVRWIYIPFSGRAFDARVVERWTSGGPWRFRVVEDRLPLVFVSEPGGGFDLRLITYEGSPTSADGTR